MESSLSQYPKSYGAINAYDNARLQLGDTYVLAADTPSDGTFDWIFDGTHPPYESFVSLYEPYHFTRGCYSDPSGSGFARCSNFTQWLRQRPEDTSSSTFWWIKGKAGSGKSTLMSHLCYRISQFTPYGGLDSGQTTILLKHFFWELGNPLQRSMLGCLRTLLWQFFASYPDRGLAFWQEYVQQKLRPSGAWTPKLLNDTFDLVINRHDAKFAVFVDGLDECTDRAQLLQFLRKQQSNSQIRLCVSSRPDRNLELAMNQWPSIKLEDLTEDMRRYVETEISAAVSTIHGSNLDPFRHTEDLVDMLVAKAEGVFIWLTIACRSLIEGVENLDSPDVLLSRLEELPGDILQLYNHMLQRNKKDLKRYAETAASVFTFLLHGDPKSPSSTIPLAWLSWALDDSARAMLLQPKFEYHSVLSIYKTIDHERTDVWIKTYCGNLIEAYRRVEEISVSDALRVDPSIVKNSRYKFWDVRFVHKTVADFLVDTIEGQSLLAACSMTGKRGPE